MSLANYHKKRNFKKSPEPKGKKTRTSSKKLKYVIQEHAARSHHYDLRLEMHGVLKSWAIPKGPSLDPEDKRLAVHVEDHPLDYGTFEGVIPKGHYGAGVVTVWDKGEWQCLDEDMDQAFKKGHLSVLLKGKKLKGRWNLVQMKNSPDNWLFIKTKDDDASSSSKLSGTRSKMPSLIHPQLATLVDKPPLGNNWLHEVKFDGYRMLGFINNNKIKLITRNGHDWTKMFTHLVKQLVKLNLSTAIFDGEVVAINEKNEYDFQLLQNLIHENCTEPLHYYVFDLIYYNGYDLTDFSLVKRKEILKELIPKNNKIIHYSDHVIGDGDSVYENACHLGLEGIISKEINSSYLQRRSDSWLKSKCIKRQEFIICGFTKPRGTRKYFGSLILGVYDADHKLHYCGHVGTGFSEQSLMAVSRLLNKYQTSSMPFDHIPIKERNITWVQPKCVAEVQFSGWTQDNILRHPSFKGVRIDKAAKEIHKEKSMLTKNVSFKKGKIKKPVITLTSPEKLLFPKQKITKLDLAQYYEKVSDLILPYIVHRPLTWLRCPDGIEDKCFYQRHFLESAIDSVYTVDIDHHDPYLYIKDQKGLMSLCQLSVLEIHPWGVHIDKPNNPDVIIFDLDPAPDVEWRRVVTATRFIREQLENINLTSFIKTTGGKGLHITIPIRRNYTWEEIQSFTQAFSETLALLDPKNFISVMTKAKRVGKIYVDYLRNQPGATAIAPYSVRAKPGAPIATPLSWDELSSKIKPDSFTIKNIVKRLDKLKSDPWKGYFNLHQILKFI